MQQEFEIISYQDECANEPFSKWFSELDWQLQNIVISRINRVKAGNFGDCEFVGDKIFELRIHVGAGYRIYFAKESGRLVLLLCAGSKS